jgi:tetratricopeptide (TPR) repeat protein
MLGRAVFAHVKRVMERKHSEISWAMRAVLAGLIGLLGACATSGQTTAPPRSAAKTNNLAPSSANIARIVVTPEATRDIPELFAEATAEGQAQRYEVAAQTFDAAFTLDADGPLADKSLFESAEMYDMAGQHEAALARYEQVARRFPNSALDRLARIRALRLLTYLEQYQRGGVLAELTAAKYPDLRSFDRLAELSARALARLSVGDDVQADSWISKARDIIERESLDAAGRVPAELAPVYFALGELRRLRAERIHFVPVPENFAAVLERRCQLLLDAQSAYSDAMRAYDSHWSAMAGFRVGELYQKLHDELMRVPSPKAADSERRRQLFEGAMRLRYSILLDKARSMMDHTVAMADRTGEQSEWVLKSRQARDQIVLATRAEQEALAKLPYTRPQLQAALDSFAAGRPP